RLHVAAVVARGRFPLPRGGGRGAAARGRGPRGGGGGGGGGRPPPGPFCRRGGGVEHTGRVRGGRGEEGRRPLRADAHRGAGRPRTSFIESIPNGRPRSSVTSATRVPPSSISRIFAKSGSCVPFAGSLRSV